MQHISHEEIEALKLDLFSSLRCALPGTVEAWDPETQTADIRPAAPGRHPGSRPPKPLPVLKDVPVFLPRGLESQCTVSPGDGCLVIFCDYPLDAWLTGDDTAPAPDRRHDLSDAVALIGFRTQTTQGGDP